MTPTIAIAIGMSAGALLGLLSTVVLRQAVRAYAGRGSALTGVLLQAGGLMLATAGLWSLARHGGGALPAGLAGFAVARLLAVRGLVP